MSRDTSHRRAPEAETVYCETCAAIAKTAGALYGLMQALIAQGENEDALVEARLKKAWGTRRGAANLRGYEFTNSEATLQSFVFEN